MQKPVSKTAAILLCVVWIIICTYILIYAQQIDGPLIMSLIISGALVLIPITKSFKKNK